MDASVWLWLGFAAFVGGLLAFDLGVLSNTSKAMSGREALVRCVAYVMLAMVFGAGIFYFQGSDTGLEFLTAYLIEYSLSIDNIFVMVLIFTHCEGHRSALSGALVGFAETAGAAADGCG